MHCAVINIWIMLTQRVHSLPGVKGCSDENFFSARLFGVSEEYHIDAGLILCIRISYLQIGSTEGNECVSTE